MFRRSYCSCRMFACLSGSLRISSTGEPWISPRMGAVGLEACEEPCLLEVGKECTRQAVWM